eukprot:m.158169 g.158169  ORF g.158169 m.158169 type:complete len:972 (-) comp15128_c0_seq3:55-2970(-)
MANVEALTGWFKKDAAGKIGRAQSRWFVFEPESGAIAYYSSERAATADLKGAIQLKDVLHVTSTNVRLEISTEERKYVLETQAPEIAVRWVAAITSYLEQSQGAEDRRESFRVRAQTSPSMPGAVIDKSQWLPSKAIPRCMGCGVKFTLTLRKHHCRFCGQVFCDPCSPVRKAVALKKGGIRVCNECIEVFGDDDDDEEGEVAPQSNKKELTELAQEVGDPENLTVKELQGLLDVMDISYRGDDAKDVLVAMLRSGRRPSEPQAAAEVVPVKKKRPSKPKLPEQAMVNPFGADVDAGDQRSRSSSNPFASSSPDAVAPKSPDNNPFGAAPSIDNGSSKNPFGPAPDVVSEGRARSGSNPFAPENRKAPAHNPFSAEASPSPLKTETTAWFDNNDDSEPAPQAGSISSLLEEKEREAANKLREQQLEAKKQERLAQQEREKEKLAQLAVERENQRIAAEKQRLLEISREEELRKKREEEKKKLAQIAMFKEQERQTMQKEKEKLAQIAIQKENERQEKEQQEKEKQELERQKEMERKQKEKEALLKQQEMERKEKEKQQELERELRKEKEIEERRQAIAQEEQRKQDRATVTSETTKKEVKPDAGEFVFDFSFDAEQNKPQEKVPPPVAVKKQPPPVAQKSKAPQERPIYYVAEVAEDASQKQSKTTEPKPVSPTSSSTTNLLPKKHPIYDKEITGTEKKNQVPAVAKKKAPVAVPTATNKASEPPVSPFGQSMLRSTSKSPTSGSSSTRQTPSPSTGNSLQEKLRALKEKADSSAVSTNKFQKAPTTNNDNQPPWAKRNLSPTSKAPMEPRRNTVASGSIKSSNKPTSNNFTSSQKPSTTTSSSSASTQRRSTKADRKVLALEWCQRMAEGSGVEIKNFNKSFGDGLAFCAIMHGLFPDKIPMKELTKSDRRRNFELAFRVAEDAGQEPILDVDDCVELPYPDSLSVMTYIFEMQRKFGKGGVLSKGVARF